MMVRPEPMSADNGEHVALLCVADNGQDVPFALSSAFGQPLLHHIIKGLETIGITRFFVAVNAVPGALLSYCDNARQKGLDIACVRNPAEVALKLSDGARILALTADSVWDPELLEKALGQKRPIIATIEEHSENRHFERIDLNSRWAGLVVLERKSLAKLAELPDDWDVGSALLRQAQQDGIAHWQIMQSQVQAGKLHKLAVGDDLAEKLSHAMVVKDAWSKSLEAVLFTPLFRPLEHHVWSANWSRLTVEWLFPGLFLLSALFALTNLAVPALVAAILGISASALRTRARLLEYRCGERDWIGATGWAFAAVALGSLLFHHNRSVVDAAYASSSIILLSLFAAKYSGKRHFWVLSPLTIVLSALIGSAVGAIGWALQAIVLAQLVSLLVSQLRQKTDDQDAIERA